MKFREKRTSKIENLYIAYIKQITMVKHLRVREQIAKTVLRYALNQIASGKIPEYGFRGQVPVRSSAGVSEIEYRDIYGQKFGRAQIDEGDNGRGIGFYFDFDKHFQDANFSKLKWGIKLGTKELKKPKPLMSNKPCPVKQQEDSNEPRRARISDRGAIELERRLISFSDRL